MIKNKKFDYAATINSVLKPSSKRNETVLDLFAGCGGLALGFEAQGFNTIGYEKNKDCCDTYNLNLHGECHNIELSLDTQYPKAKVVIGGPPCQPFSVGGRQLGLKDSRDGFPIFIDAIEKVAPDIFMFENVRGLLYRNKWYLEEVISKLETLGYIVEEAKLLNAKHYGVPQNRERIIVVGHKGEFKFPKANPYHVTAGDALQGLKIEENDKIKYLTPSQDKYVAKYEKASDCITPRDLHLHKPARTLTCRNLAGATGDMQRVRLPDGRRRRLLPKEAARLQSFPDWFKFSGEESSIFYQIGNAVPPLFSYCLAKSIVEYLNSDYPHLKNITQKKIRRFKQQKIFAA